MAIAVSRKQLNPFDVIAEAAIYVVILAVDIIWFPG
jgi:hypothetical protein